MDKFELGKASMHEDGFDRISNLPDHVLPLILSGLPSTKESIRTSVLSKRWRDTWTSIPSVDFDYHGGRESSETSKFENVVNRALLYRSVDLESVRLSCSDYFSRSTLERWIHATVTRNVKHLDLTFRLNEESEDMVMPHCLATCASLEVLKFFAFGGRLILPSSSGFPALRVLKLRNAVLSDGDLVKQFLESCPLLENLTLKDSRVDILDLLCISCPKLKKLSFRYWSTSDLCGCLKVCCPNLEFLKILGRVATNYIFEGPYSLKEAVIDPESTGLELPLYTTSGLFQFISHVESLRTGLSLLYKCIDAAPDQAFPNLKTLELTTWNDPDTVSGLKKILKICPKLLVLNVQKDRTYEEVKQWYDETEYPNLDGVGTWNLTPDVAWVEFFEYNGEKPKLTIHRYDNDWRRVHAKWGNKAMFSH